MSTLYGGCTGPRTLRERLWQNGYRPVIIPEGKKYPIDRDWHDRALRNPPASIADGPNGHPFTGLATSGLRLIDIDVGNPDHVDIIAGYCHANFGEAPMRMRGNANRVALLYRATEGTPTKVKVWNSDNKEGVEVLGHGQQFMAYGRHPSGADFVWCEDQGPHNIPVTALPAITEEQVRALLTFAEPFVGQAAKQTQTRMSSAAPGMAREPSTVYEGDVSLEDVAEALAAIPNLGMSYDDWFHIGTAIHTATSGSNEGYNLWLAWSHNDGECDPIWKSLDRKNNHTIKFGTLIHYARLYDPMFRKTELLPLNLFRKHTA